MQMTLPGRIFALAVLICPLTLLFGKNPTEFSNAERASGMNASLQRPLLLLSRLFRERALIRDTQDEYSADVHTAENWRRQFLAVGGHIDSTAGTNH